MAAAPLRNSGLSAVPGPVGSAAGHAGLVAPGDWAAHTQSHLSEVTELRQEIQKQFQREALANETEKGPNIGGPAVEDRLKRRQRNTQSLAAQVASKTESIQHIIYQARQTISELSRSTTSARASLSVVEMRIHLRSQRPPSELTEDSFGEALLQERAVLQDVVEKIVDKSATGQDVVSSLEEAKSELHSARLTLHLDRTGCTQQLLDHIAGLEKFGAQFCKDADSFLEEAAKRCKKVSGRTCSAMKQRIAETLELKEKIEKDMKETRRTICEAELHLERLERQLQAHLAMPERQTGNEGGDFMNAKLSQRSGVVAELRAKIKAAAYTGAQGRQLNVVFGRFDRNNSGVLDEDEVRRAFRRACRIPPSVVTDAEISSLCELLDEDKSGTISIQEITDFLCADVNVESLEQQCNWATTALSRLKAAQRESQEDLRSKVAAWKVDAACARVNPIKGMKLDGMPSLGRPSTSSDSAFGFANTSTHSMTNPGNRPVTASSSSPRMRMGLQGSPRKPKAKAQPGLPFLPPRGKDTKPSLDPLAMDTLRSRIKAAAYTGTQGRQLDVVLGRFDKDHSGTLEEDEVRQALRRTLRIPPSVVSDADISALCTMLDDDMSGNISISELVAFVGVEPEVSKRTGKTIPGHAAHGQKGQAGPPDESAGPTNST